MEQHRSRARRRWPRIALVAIVTAAVVAPSAVWAADKFTDVPESNIFHDDIAWLADANVTKGCNPPDNTLYCPSDNVTREQMAAFMRNLAENQVVDAATALDAAALAGSTPGAAVAELDWSAATNAPLAELDSFTVDVPAAGTLIVEVAGTIHMNSDSGSDNALTVSANLGLCDESADSDSCDGTYRSVWYQDPDDSSGTNATPGISMTRVVDVTDAGPRTFYVNGTGPSTGSFNDWQVFATVTYLPGANSLSPLTLSGTATDDDPGLTQD